MSQIRARKFQPVRVRGPFLKDSCKNKTVGSTRVFSLGLIAKLEYLIYVAPSYVCDIMEMIFLYYISVPSDVTNEYKFIYISVQHYSIGWIRVNLGNKININGYKLIIIYINMAIYTTTFNTFRDEGNSSCKA